MTQNIIHPTDLYYIEFRQDYLLICRDCAYKKSKNGKKSKASPHCKALMLAVLERWMACKKEGEPVYLSISKWIEALYGMYGRNVIIDSLDELAGEGLIFRRGCKTRGGEMYGYLLNTDELNTRLSGLLLNHLTSKPVDETDESGLLINQKRFTNQPLDTESGLKVNRKRFKSKHIIDYTDTSNIDTTQIQESVIANASHIPTLDSSSQETESEETGEAELAAPSHDPSPIATQSQPHAQETGPDTEQDSLFPVATFATEDEWKAARTEQMASLQGEWKKAIAATRDRYKTLSGYRGHHIKLWEAEHPCPPKIALTPDEAVIWDRWNTLFRKPVPLSAAAKKACADLAPCDPSAEDLRAAWHYCRENDRNGFYAKRGVRIWDVAREYEGWYMLHEAQILAEEKKSNVIQASERFTPPPLNVPVPYEQTRAYLEQQRNEIRAQQRKQVLV